LDTSLVRQNIVRERKKEAARAGDCPGQHTTHNCQELAAPFHHDFSSVPRPRNTISTKRIQ
jgi:hypothetical protein